MHGSLLRTLITAYMFIILIGAGLIAAGSVDVTVSHASCGGVCSPKVPDEPVHPPGL